jgi:hypothetical protein
LLSFEYVLTHRASNFHSAALLRVDQMPCVVSMHREL